jgi:hypothetical protein
MVLFFANLNVVVLLSGYVKRKYSGDQKRSKCAILNCTFAISFFSFREFLSAFDQSKPTWI